MCISLKWHSGVSQRRGAVWCVLRWWSFGNDCDTPMKSHVSVRACVWLSECTTWSLPRHVFHPFLHPSKSNLIIHNRQRYWLDCVEFLKRQPDWNDRRDWDWKKQTMSWLRSNKTIRLSFFLGFGKPNWKNDVNKRLISLAGLVLWQYRVIVENEQQSAPIHFHSSRWDISPPLRTVDRPPCVFFRFVFALLIVFDLTSFAW